MNMYRTTIRQQQGFTLLELVIVLGVTGIIFGGLWGLLSNSGGQVRAQGSGQAYRQVVDAARKYYASDVATPTCAVNTPVDVTVAAINAAANTTAPLTDSYGTIRVTGICRNAASHIWNFAVWSANSGANGPDDKTGAQIASLIGAEGGFVYRNPTDGCTTAATATTTACGTFGSFTQLVTAYTTPTNGLTAGSGRIFAVATTSDGAVNSAPWLARIDMPTTPFNTVTAPQTKFSTGANVLMQGNNITEVATLTGYGTAVGGTPSYTLATTGTGATLTASATGSLALSGPAGVSATATAANANVALASTGGVISLTTANNITGNINLNSAAAINMLLGTNNPYTVKITGGISPNPILTVNGWAFATVLTAGSFYYQSDESLKTNIHPIPNALEKIASLHGVNFEWKDPAGHPAKNDIGVIAQQVQKVFPEAVSTLAGGKLGVDYPRLIGPLVEAVRQLKEENDALKARLEKLEGAKK